ncbi:MAG: helicase-associated domain-containing protein [Synechococcales bacterium]|nr:helicase-associated domain-containing protein [Synechococcales bacterium]
MLQLLPVGQKSIRKADLIDAVANYLLGPELKTLWDGLDELQQAAIAEAVHTTQGYYEQEQFRAKYGDLPTWNRRNYYSTYNQPAAKLDLFFYPLSNYGAPTLMPEDLRLKLKVFVAPPKLLALHSHKQLPPSFEVKLRHFDYEQRKTVKTTEAVPIVCALREQAAQQDLLAVLRLIQMGQVSVSDKTYMPSKATLSAIAPILQGGDYYSEADEPGDSYHDPIGIIKPFAWVMLVQAGGLASLDGKKLQLTKAGQKAVGAAPAKTLKAIWKKWLKTTLLDELRRVEAIKGQTGKAKRSLTAVSGRRSQIVDALRLCPTGEWVEFDELKRFMIASHQIFEVSRSPSTLYINEPGYGYLYEAGDAWGILQDSYMRCFLFEYAATLGLVDIAYIPPYKAPRDSYSDFWGTDDLSFLSRYDGLFAIRLTPLGGFCLDLTDAYTSAPVVTESTLRVLPNLDIVMAGTPLTPAETLMMNTFSQQTADAVWKLDQETMLKAIAAGHSPDEFYDFLTQASAGNLPKTVEQFFDDCRRRGESLQDLGLARLIKCADAPLAAQIAHDSRTRKYCYLAGDCYLVVPIDQETRFRNALRKLGYSLPLANG